MFNQKQPKLPPAYHIQPEFINVLCQEMRDIAYKDNVLSVNADRSARTVVAFTARWSGQAPRDVPRRVFVETKLTDENQYSVVFMAKVFDDAAVNRFYTQDQFANIAKDLYRYLRLGHLPN